MPGVWSRRILGVLGGIAINVIAAYAFVALRDSALPFGNIVAVLIWPIAMILVAGITIAVVTGERVTDPETAAPLAESASEDVTAARARLAELEDQDKRIKQKGLLAQIENEVRLAGDFIANYGPNGGQDIDQGWSDIKLWEDRIERTLGDPLWPEGQDLADFTKNIGTMLTDVAGRDRLGRYVTIKRQSLQRIQGKYSLRFL